MKRLSTLLFAFLVGLTAWAQQPKQLTEELLVKLEKNFFKANYMVSVTEKATDAPQIYRGTILMKGDKFHISMDGVEVYFDGKTQWTYMEDADEINIAEPTTEDVAEINPILLAKGMLANCELRFSDTQKDAQAYLIDFYPKAKKTDVQKLTLRVRKSDKMLLGGTLKSTKGMTTELVLSAQQFGVSATDKDFEPDMKQYKTAIINDLR